MHIVTNFTTTITITTLRKMNYKGVVNHKDYLFNCFSVKHLGLFVTIIFFKIFKICKKV